MDRELNTSIGRKLITIPLDANNNIVKTDKLACIMEMVLSLDQLDNADNLENRILSNVLFRYLVTGSEEFTNFQPIAPQYKRLKLRGVCFPNPENNGPKGQWCN